MSMYVSSERLQVKKNMLKAVYKTTTSCAMAMMLFGCATDNALLQSPNSNTTTGVDQINRDLDSILSPDVPPLELDSNIENSLLPPSDLGVSPLDQEPRFDISVIEHPAKLFFQSLVAESGRNVVVHPDVEGAITLSLKDVTATEVLNVVKELYGYEYTIDDRLIMVFPTGLRTRIFQIDYLDLVRSGGSETQVRSGQITQTDEAFDDENDSRSSTSTSGSFGTRIQTTNENTFWQNLEATVRLIIGDEEGRSVVITPSAGMVVVRADSQEIWAIEEYLRASELTLTRQVLLEAKVLEVELSEGYQQGIDWSFTEAGEFRAGVPNNTLSIGQTPRAVSVGDAGGIFSTALKLGSFNATIDLLGTQGNVQVLSSPRIATVNNQKAVIKVGSDEYFVTDIEFESDTDTDTNSTDIDFTPFFSGIALDVTPQISDDGRIILHVHPAISDVVDQQKNINIAGDALELPLALSTIRESDSVIVAEDGQIVVIGGLIQTISRDENSSVPFFGDLPLIGELFKQKSKELRKTELVILLRPTLTDNGVFLDDVRQSRDRFGGLRSSLRSAPETSFYD